MTTEGQKPSHGSQNRRHKHNNKKKPNTNHLANNKNKYLMKAKDALSSGDKVLAENFFQHAEHYIRLMNVAQGED